MHAQNQPGYTFAETDEAIHFSIRSEKHWWQFLLVIASLLGVVAVFLFIVLKLIAMLEDGLTGDATLHTFIVFLVSVLVLCGLYLSSRNSLNNAFVQEDIKITVNSISIERSGFLGFRLKKVIPAEKIKGISLLIQLSVEDNRLADMLFNTSKMGKLVITTRQRVMPKFPICRGISTDEVRLIVDKILLKFPQYRYI